MVKTITNLNGEKERVNLPTAHYTADANGPSDFTGIWVTGLYSGPRTGRRFVRTHSIWVNGQGSCTGTKYRELSESDYLDYCQKVGAEPVHVPVSEV